MPIASVRKIDALVLEFNKIAAGDYRTSKIGQLCEELMALSKGTAEDLFSDAVNAVAGTPDEKDFPNIDFYHWTDDGKAIQFTASGKDVLFLEFGTGLVNFGESTRSENYPSDSEFRSSWMFGPGSYSAFHGQFLTDDKKLNGLQGKWPVPGRKGADRFASGSNPAKAMYEAEKTFHQQFDEVAHRVFGD